MKKQFIALIALLGFTEKAKTADFSAEELQKIDAECQKQFGLSYVDTLKKVMEENEEPLDIALTEENKAIMTALFGEKKSEENSGTSENAVKAIEDLKTTVATQKQQIEVLGQKAETTDPKHVNIKPKVVAINSGVSNNSHLFSIDHDFFALTKPWNAIAARRLPLATIAAVSGLDSDWKEYEGDFQKEYTKYAKSVAKRIGELQASNSLSNIKMDAIDYSGFAGTGWGEEYIVRRQDALIAYIRSLPSVATIFPVRYGVQNKEELTNSFLGTFSQSYQAGNVFKGSHSVEPSLAEVFKAMFKFKFSGLKTLENEYIGYLNREDSQPIKWTLIEWLMVNTLKALQNEWNDRRIRGVRIEPTTDKPGSYLHASDGVIRKLRKLAYDEYRLQPVSSIANYTASTILTAVETFIEFVNQKLPALQGYSLYMNLKHVPWYLAAYRAKYGHDLDFDGALLKVLNYQLDSIIAVPNMGNNCFMWITAPGNIELLEMAAGEMAKFYFQQFIEDLYVCSWWAEGVNGYMTGRKYADAASRDAENYKSQYIFITEPIIDLLTAATTADASKGDWFRTADNVAAAALTDILNAEAGVVYRIICGNVTTHATTIAKAGKFSALTAAYTPTAVGDFIEVYLYQNEMDSTDALNGKFIEVQRKVTVIPAG